ncbi:tyrosine-type recombinase/integrase [Sorangium sp. So ce1000]|uniref:tyrosine-type recombinase/integrase n=1 Tax=Sorangium sp. So ce1000 TaxID=3133325 RepID=UPI003F603CA8
MATKTKDQPVKLPRGNVEERGGSWSLRVRLGGERKRIPLGSGMSEAKAREKADAWLERMAREGYGVDAPPAPREGVTVREHFDAWISGALLREHGPVNGLREKASADVDGWRAAKYIYPAIGDKLVHEVTEQDIDRVMARVPRERREKTHLQLYSLLRRGFDLAVMPARLRKDNPVTRYHRPPKGTAKLFAYLLPSEVLALLACVEIAIGRRVLYALAVYTGLRKSSLMALKWKDVDITNAMLAALITKNGVPQLFEIPADLVSVLRAWRARCGDPADDERVVQDVECVETREAEQLREDLRAAGVTRAVLFSKEKNVAQVRFHDLRASFVTWAKRAGKSEGWISDRTGHLDRAQLDRYTRAARTLADLRIVPFPDITGAIPELAPAPADGPGGPLTEGGGTPEGGPTGRTHGHLAAAIGGLRSSKKPGKCSTSHPHNPDTGSSERSFEPRRLHRRRPPRRRRGARSLDAFQPVHG